MATVAHYIHRYLPLTESWIADQLRFIRSYRTFVLAVHTTGRNGARVVSLDAASLPVRVWNDAMRVTRGRAPLHENACRREDVALIHAHFGDRACKMLALARRLRVPLVVSFYGRDMWRQPRRGGDLRRRYERLFAEGDLFLAEGPAARERLIQIGCPSSKAVVHRLGVDVANIAFVPRRIIGDANAPVRVLMAARFAEKKGLEYGLRAFCAAAEGEPRLELTIAGDAGRSRQEQDVKRRLQQIAQASPAAQRIRFTGFVPKEQLMQLAYAHHLFLQPSVTATDGDAEGGHPVVMVEVAASGMPIIATRHCDIPQIVTDGISGSLTDERDVDGLAAAIRDFIASPERITEFGTNARRHVEERYDARLTRLDSVYDVLLAAR